MPALVAGFALVFAFAPYGWWPLAVLSPAFLLWLLRDATGRRAFLLGYSYGLGMFGYGVWWLQVSVHQFGVPHYAFSVTVTALFIAAMALYPALFAVVLTRFRLPWLAAAPAWWVIIEYLRGWLFTGFPWLALGYSQSDAPLATVAPVAGVYGISWLVMMQAVLLLEMVRGTMRVRIVTATALVAVLGCAVGLGRVEFTASTGDDLKVVLIQGAIPQELKWQRNVRAASIALYEQLSSAHWDADVLIWPETAIAAFPHEVEPLLARLTAQARASQTDLLIGMPTGEPWDGRYFNSVVELGATPGQYDKRHLVPFGEFFPFKDAISGIAALLSIPLSDFSTGKPAQVPLTVAGYPAGISICYEDAFGLEVNDALPAAAFLVNVSNDAWFGDTIAPHQHLQIARLRALETGRYLLRATNTGITAVIDHRGRLTAAAEPFVETSLRATFSARSGATPYVRYGDWPVLSVALACLAGGVLIARRRGGSAVTPG